MYISTYSSKATLIDILKLTSRSPSDVDVHLRLFEQIPYPGFEVCCIRRQKCEGQVQWPVKKGLKSCLEDQNPQGSLR